MIIQNYKEVKRIIDKKQYLKYINEIFNENDIDKKMKELDIYQGDLYKK